LVDSVIQSHRILLGVMLLSSLLQFFAAFLAIRLIRPSGAFTAWIILACGFTIQGIRRIISLVQVFNGQLQGDMTVEVLGLAISLIMLCGILKFKPLFDEINRTHNALLEKQDKLTKANQELESFVSTVSHDLRNPLTVIIGFAEHLRKNRSNNLDQHTQECLEDIEAHGVRMAALLEDLLALAKVGYIKRPVESIDVIKVLQDVLCELEHLLADKKVTVNVGDLPKICVPEALLEDVFKNLIGNAICYACKEGDAIDVWGERTPSSVRFYVRDHGPGIPEEERSRIFEMFYRGSTGKAFKGTGIGLAVVQKFVQLYDGRVWVEETPQGGSTFCLELQDA
jgi:light-regulated signal transduction histidine kinase (bacteriophytochrome)